MPANKPLVPTRNREAPLLAAYARRWAAFGANVSIHHPVRQRLVSQSCRALLFFAAFGSATFAHSTRAADSIEGYILGPEEGQPAMNHLVKVDPALGSKHLGLGTQILKPGRGIEFHAHGVEDEILYVVRGRGIGAVGTAKARLEPGSIIYTPAGAWHAVHAEEEMEIVWVSSPPEFSRYLRDLHSARRQGELNDERWGVIAQSHSFRDGRGFLKEFLGGTEWQGDTDPWTLLRYEKSGVVASVGEPANRATLELFDPSQDALGFLGRWRPHAADPPQTVVLHYDPSQPNMLRIAWGPQLDSVTTLRRRE
jgi:quercetin dioxygenase-like cupin family protein